MGQICDVNLLATLYNYLAIYHLSIDLSIYLSIYLCITVHIE